MRVLFMMKYLLLCLVGIKILFPYLNLRIIIFLYYALFLIRIAIRVKKCVKTKVNYKQSQYALISESLSISRPM